MNTDDLRDEDGDPRVDDIVEEFWSYDGPHTPWKIRSALYAATQLIRYANNATQYPDRIANGPLLGVGAGSVNALTYGLDQLLDQLARAAERVAEDPTLYDDRAPREQGGDTARGLAAELDQVRRGLLAVRPALDRAAQLGSRLGHRSEGEA